MEKQRALQHEQLQAAGTWVAGDLSDFFVLRAAVSPPISLMHKFLDTCVPQCLPSGDLRFLCFLVPQCKCTQRGILGPRFLVERFRHEIAIAMISLQLPCCSPRRLVAELPGNVLLEIDAIRFGVLTWLRFQRILL